MKAVMSSVPPDILAWRKRTGADQFDEMWEGVLHMVPSPNRTHQDLEGALETWLRIHWAPQANGRVFHQINLAHPGRWPDDFRIPDLVLLTQYRFAIDKDEYFEGGPDVVVEIKSPDDDTLEKIPFYAEIGVREIWIIDRDTKEIQAMDKGRLEALTPDPDGWWRSPTTGVEMVPAGSGKLAVRLAGDDGTRQEIP